MSDAAMREAIKNQVAKRVEELREKSREDLSAIFERTFGSQPHPKALRNFILEAITREYQSSLWLKETGSVPKDIASKDLSFWNKDTLALLNKDGIKNERAAELSRKKGREVVETTKESSGNRALEESILHLKCDENPYDKDAKPYHYSLVEILKKLGKPTPYGDVEKLFRKKNGAKIRMPSFVILTKSDGFVETEFLIKQVVEQQIIETLEDVSAPSKVVNKLQSQSRMRKRVVLGDPNYSKTGSRISDVLQ